MDTDPYGFGLESAARARSQQKAGYFPVSGGTPGMRSITARTRTGARLAALGGLAALLAACGTYNPDHPPIDHSVQAQSQNSRVQFVVLHYTSADNEPSLRILSRGNVSSHYLVTNEARQIGSASCRERVCQYV